MNSEAELADWLRELWMYVITQTEHITRLSERITELERRLDQKGR